MRAARISEKKLEINIKKSSGYFRDCKIERTSPARVYLLRAHVVENQIEYKTCCSNLSLFVYFCLI